mmetsp:Transcript_14351/g.35564  ORF Transcript_14351/g.35564 Transcript_14351/m.35564 type:complete len:398 (+) Transcript_14351:235-1428(+)
MQAVSNVLEWALHEARTGLCCIHSSQGTQHRAYWCKRDDGRQGFAHTPVHIHCLLQHQRDCTGTQRGLVPARSVSQHGALVTGLAGCPVQRLLPQLAARCGQVLVVGVAREHTEGHYHGAGGGGCLRHAMRHDRLCHARHCVLVLQHGHQHHLASSVNIGDLPRQGVRQPQQCRQVGAAARVHRHQRGRVSAQRLSQARGGRLATGHDGHRPAEDLLASTAEAGGKQVQRAGGQRGVKVRRALAGWHHQAHAHVCQEASCPEQLVGAAAVHQQGAYVVPASEGDGQSWENRVNGLPAQRDQGIPHRRVPLPAAWQCIRGPCQHMVHPRDVAHRPHDRQQPVPAGLCSASCLSCCGCHDTVLVPHQAPEHIVGCMLQVYHHLGLAGAGTDRHRSLMVS